MKEKKKRMFKNNSSNKIIISVLTFAFVFSVCLLPFIDKGTHSADVDILDVLQLSCPSEINYGDIFVDCNLVLTSSDGVRGISAKYGDNIGFQWDSFNVSSELNYQDYYNYSDGFVITFDDINGDNLVLGTIKFDVLITENIDKLYNISLSDIHIGYNDKEEQVDDITSSVMLKSVIIDEEIKSDINTLSKIVIDGKEISLTDDILEYEFTTDSESISIEVEKTDNKSIVSGYANPVGLSVGSNEIVIVVTSESGKIRQYKLLITRSEKFDYVISDK